MDKLFLTVLNMSLTGAFVIAAICLVRLSLKKAPKSISYCLWAVAGFRLVFPFSIESMFSLIPFKAQPIPQDIAMQAVPRFDSGIGIVDNVISTSLPPASTVASINPLQIWLFIGSCVWFFGVAVLLIYGVVSFIILKRKMRKSARIEANIYESENIQSPFVLGIFNPRIYLPVGLSDQERNYVILHEQTHIRRHDHVVKFAAYFILCLHWFNPLAWVAFALMGADMEMSCDERVLKDIGGDTKHDYSRSLLSLATERRVIGGSPLAFSEGDLKARIKNVLNFKKPSRVIITIAVALVTVLSVGCALNRAVVILPTPANDLNALFSMRTPYVGDNSAVGKIVDALPSLDEEHTQRFFSIGDDYGTGRTPFTLTIYYEPIGTESSDSRNMTLAPKNYALLFALIDNLEEVNYAFRKTPSGPELDKAAYTSSVRFSRDDVNVHLESLGLSWDDFQNDWDGTVKKLFADARERDPNQQRLMTLDDVRAIAQKSGPGLTMADFRDFIGKDIGSGMYIMQYEVDGGSYQLIADSSRMESVDILTAFGRVTDGKLDENAIDIRYYDVDKYIADGTRELVSRTVPEPRETMPPSDATSPTEIVRNELVGAGYDIQYILLLSHSDRKSSQDTDNGETALVYASYIDGDAIYNMRYDFERVSDASQWTHAQPAFWDGIAIDVAAYVAREYFAERTGIKYGDVVVSWARQEEAEALFPDIAKSHFAAFYIGESGNAPVVIIATSPDGQSHWKVIGYDGDLIDSGGNYYVPRWAVEAHESGTLYCGEFGGYPGELFVRTLEGDQHVSVNDYVIQGVKGELYPCKPDIFEATYEPA